MTASEGVGRRALARNAAMLGEWHPLGIRDGIGLTANDGTGQLVTFVAPVPSVTSLRRRLAARYEYLAAHVAAGWRLRRSLNRHATAVLTPAGKLVHAEGVAAQQPARERLREAAVSIDRARGALRQKDDQEALELWRVLVRGEWSLVDRFERDGRRYLVAHRNAPNLRDPRGLKPRERQVVALTALGHSLKLIAYELGLSTSRVWTIRARAMRKLGLRSVVELAQLFRGEPPPNR